MSDNHCRYCCLGHALEDVDAPGDAGAVARWEAAEYARLVQAGEMERWCGHEVARQPEEAQ